MKALQWIMGVAVLSMACTGKNAVVAEEVEVNDSDSVAIEEDLLVDDTLVFEAVSWRDSLSYKVKIVDYSGDEEPYPYEVKTVTDTYEAASLRVVAGRADAAEFLNQWLAIDAASEAVESPVTAEKVAVKYAELKRKRGVHGVLSAMKSASKTYLNGASNEDDEDGMTEMPFESNNEHSSSIELRWQTPTLVTLWDSGYEYAAGAAHGMPWGCGRTFDLKNMRILTLDDILTKAGRKTVLKMIVTELRDEYSNALDMMNPPAEIDFPGAAPSLMADGVHFDYGDYEVGAHALGLPGVVLPYKKLKPYLTPEVKELLDME